MRPANYPPTKLAPFQPNQFKCERCRGWRYVCSCGCPNNVIDHEKYDALKKEGFKFSGLFEHAAGFDDSHSVVCPDCSYLPYV